MGIRGMLSSAVMYAAFVMAIVVAALWCYWIWGFDWGRGREWDCGGWLSASVELSRFSSD